MNPQRTQKKPHPLVENTAFSDLHNYCEVLHEVP